MPKVSPEVLKSVQEALTRYIEEVEASPLARKSKRTYLLHSRNFVRWLNDDFQPSAHKR